MIHLLLQPAPQSPPNDTSLYWLLAGLAAVTILYTVFRPSFRRKDPLSRSSPGASLAQQRGVERDMQNLLVELSEMSRQISAQLDTRAAKLELLLREADEKIARLNSLPAPRSGSPTESSASHGEETPAVMPESDSRHRAVYDLADQGLDVAQIAQRLDRPSGEIELIMALRSRG